MCAFFGAEQMVILSFLAGGPFFRSALRQAVRKLDKVKPLRTPLALASVCAVQRRGPPQPQSMGTARVKISSGARRCSVCRGGWRAALD